MKYLKMFGLAATAAMATLAFAVGTASATTVENGTAPYGHPITWDAFLEDSALLMSTSGVLATTCAGSTVKFEETQTGTATTTSKWRTLSSGLTWSDCDHTTHTTAGGELEVHHVTGTVNGTLTISGLELRIDTSGNSCWYGFGSLTHLGQITGHSATPVLHVNAVLGEQTEKKFICPDTLVWTATYHIVDPIGLTVTSG